MRRATAVCIGNGIAEVISIHALRGESDPWLLPLRSSTHNFNPRPPRGGRPGRQNHTTRKDDISIHALREEGDQHRLRCRRRTAAFQSTPSVGKATGQAQDPGTRQAISIRNLHMEGDYRQADCLRRGIHDFNPRPPRGERLLGLVGLVGASCISIHALREEGDRR